MWFKIVNGAIASTCEQLPKIDRKDENSEYVNLYSLKIWEVLHNCDGEEVYRRSRGWDEAALKEFGWHYKDTSVPTVQDPSACRLVFTDYGFTGDAVTGGYAVVPYTEDELAAARAAQLDTVRDEVKANIDTKREEVLTQGFVFGGKKYACDKQSKVNMLIRAESLNNGNALPDGFGWKAVGEYEVTPMDADTFKQLVSAAADFCDKIFNQSFALKKLVNDATTEADILAVNIEFGA